MKNVTILMISLFLLCCNHVHEKSESGFFEGVEAQWMEDERALPATDSLFYLDHPAPLFRKEFQVSNTVEHATLYITAAGYYQASLNGSRIGKNVLDPAWTDFSKRIYYTEYDITSLINEGPNCLGLSLGNGFYNPLPLRKWGRRNLRTDTKVGKPTFLAKLHLSYKNGKSEEIISDTTWKYAYGPIIKNSVYLGVAYDARREIKGWDHPGHDDKMWKSAIPGKGPGGKLQKSFFPPVQVTQELTPIAIYAPEEGLWLVDMGVNFTGTYKIKLSGNEGDTVSFRFGERIHEDGTLNPMTTVIGQIKQKGMGGPGAPDIAWQTDSYIVGGDNGETWYSPQFTYHT